MVKHIRAIGSRSAAPIAGLAFCLTAVLFVCQAAANEVVQWNETTMKAIAANGQNNLVSTRTLAMPCPSRPSAHRPVSTRPGR